MINLYGITLPKLEQLMVEEGQKSYRATQLYTWIYEKRACEFDEMCAQRRESGVRNKE